MPRVLYIEDDPAMRAEVEDLLQSAGHEVTCVDSGLAGIDRARAIKPDLILVDISLPDLNGYEITLRLRGIEDLGRVPIVAVTTEEDYQTSLAVGADGVIGKPIDPQRFAKTVERFLRGHRERADESGEVRLREQSQRIVQRLEQRMRALSDANERLTEMARLRREFLQNVSHELATPMTPVVGYLRLLLEEELGPLTPLQRKCLQSIEASTRRLRQVTDTLHDVSTLETGKMHFYDLAYDFGDVVRRSIESMRARAVEQGVEIRTAIPEEPLDAVGDAEKLQRSLTHVLHNALKFMTHGGKLAVEVTSVLGGDDGPAYEVWVADSGPGIPRQALVRIMEPFYQVDGSATRSHGGVGLGLAFAGRVAEAMGGALVVASPPDRPVAGLHLPGTLVRVRVLAERPVPEAAAAP